MSIIKGSPTMKQEGGSSAAQGTAVGGGARPTMGKTETKTSAPSEPKTLGRDPGGSLK